MGRVHDEIAATTGTAGPRHRRRRTFRKRLAVWAVAPWLAAVVPFPAPSTAADDTGAATAEATAHGTGNDELFKLTPSDGTPLNHFGNDVAISGDTAVVGAPKMHWSGFTGAGAAYVFTRVGDSWTEQAKLTASDGVVGDRFGWSVAISGETIVVGAMWDDVDANVDQGSAYVFTRSAGTWSEQGKLTASAGVARDEFGISVAVSGDDVVVGAMSLADDAGVPPQGSAHVFVRSGDRWTEQAELVPSDGVLGDGFGFGVDIDGNTAVVGAPRGKGGQGSAYVFSRTAGAWTQQKTLHAPDGVADDEFGFWVGLDDDTIVVGDPSDDGKGAAYVFARKGGDWLQQEKLIASDGTPRDAQHRDGDYFGRSVSVSGDTIIVGAQADDAGPKNNDSQGSAYVFERTGTSWREQVHLTAEDGATGDLFGVSVAVSGDTAVVGASFATIGVAQGAAYVWRDASDRTRPDKPSADSVPADLSNDRPVGSEAGVPTRPARPSSASPSPAGSATSAASTVGPSNEVDGGRSQAGARTETDDELLVSRAVRKDSRPSSSPAGWAALLVVAASAVLLVRVRRGS